jgi:mono/diheme cytochrome c family protein
MLAAMVMALAAALPQPDGPAPGAPVDPAHVREVLTAKCAQCHGPQLSHPKGKFGFVTDLKRLATDPEFVVPGKPDGSYLWNQIDDGEMPPKKAKAGPLTEQEKTDIQEWIKAGAPAPPGDAGEVAPAPPDSAVKPAPSRPFLDRLGEFVGKFHILTIHFPIALLAAAAVGELWSAVRRRGTPLAAVRFCLWLGAAAAVASAGLGWLHAYYAGGEPEEVLWLHRWLGTAVGAMSPLVAWQSERDSRVAVRRSWVRWSIIAMAGLVGVAAHFGGTLVYGTSFLSF